MPLASVDVDGMNTTGIIGRLTQRLRTRTTAFLHDLAMIPVAWLAAFYLQLDFQPISGGDLYLVLGGLVLIVPMQALLFWYYGLYRGVWRFASLPDMIRIVKAVGIGTLGLMATVAFVPSMQEVPRAVPVLYGVLLVALVSGPRFLYRWFKDHHFRLEAGPRVLIVGAGRAGEMLVRELLRTHEGNYQPVAFVDDDLRKRGKELHGIRVVGPIARIPALVKELWIDLIMLAVPSASAGQMRRIVEVCERAGVPFRSVPRLEDLITGRGSIQQLREIAIEDLLGRAPVDLDWQGIRRGLAGRVILVTGAGGSIGAELCRQLARFGAKALVLIENSEYNLYRIELELRRDHPGVRLYTHLCDVRDPVAVDRIMSRYRPQVVFHAAAFKHVPMLEGQLREAVSNNVLGTRIVAEAADRCGAHEFVLISTDKAVNPVNVMGATKRAAEIFCQNFDRRSQTRFITVRFGNVLGSAGSVVPLFRQQIESGGPVTVTHPEMMRYFMTISEACQLIMQASVIGTGGEIYVLDMGEPVKIRYLAEQMIRLAGKEPDKDIKIAYTGLRPGEKLYEELFHEKERLTGTGFNKILLSSSRECDWAWLSALLDELAGAARAYDEEHLLRVLCALVPEFEVQTAVPAPAPARVISLDRSRPRPDA